MGDEISRKIVFHTRGGEEGGIVLIRRGVTTPVNPTHHSDTGFYCLPSEGWGGFTHMARSPVTAAESDGKNPRFEIDGCDTVRRSATSEKAR